MSLFTLRWVWPVVDPAAFPSESVAFARAELAEIAEARGVVYAGEPVFRIVDCTPEQARQVKAATAVVGEVEVVPAGAPIPDRPAATLRPVPSVPVPAGVDPLIGQLLHLRTRRNLPPFQLNQEAGLARGSVQQIEAGARVPKLSTLRALADLFDCDLVLVARDGAR